MIPPATSARDLLRHTLATVAYRGAKVLRDAPDSFADFRAAETTRTPLQILAHLGDLFDWALSMASGQPAWHDSKPLPWHDETQRFFASLQKFDAYLASDATLEASPEKLFQGPVADALNHIGQLAMLRRMASSPIKGENYFVSDISTGRVGQDQPKPKREFD
jgi:hypothetical protein